MIFNILFDDTFSINILHFYNITIVYSLYSMIKGNGINNKCTPVGK